MYRGSVLVGPMCVAACGACFGVWVLCDWLSGLGDYGFGNHGGGLYATIFGGGPVSGSNLTLTAVNAINNTASKPRSPARPAVR